MIFIYGEEDFAVVPTRVNGKDGIAVHLDPADDDFGTDQYLGDDLLFEAKDTALAWAQGLVEALSR